MIFFVHSSSILQVKYIFISRSPTVPSSAFSWVIVTNKQKMFEMCTFTCRIWTFRCKTTISGYTAFSHTKIILPLYAHHYMYNTVLSGVISSPVSWSLSIQFCNSDLSMLVNSIVIKSQANLSYSKKYAQHFLLQPFFIILTFSHF